MVGNQNLTQPAVESPNVVYTVNIKPVYEAHDLVVYRSEQSALKKMRRELERHISRTQELNEVEFAVDIMMDNAQRALEEFGTATYDTSGMDANRIIIEVEKHTLWG